MAVATGTLTAYAHPKGYDNTQRNTTVRGTLSISTGGTYPPGGFPCTWNFEGLKAIPPAGSGPSSTGVITPIDVNVKSIANPPTGYIYLWDNVSNSGAGSIHIFETDNGAAGSNASGPLLELGGAIPNTIVTDTIQFEAVFSRE